MNQQTWNTVQAIFNLVSALKAAFPLNKPLCLYDRLLSKITLNDAQAAEAQVSIFKNFYQNHKDEVLNNKPFPLDTRIILDRAEKIRIDLSYLMSKLPPDDQVSIREHLLTIYAIIEPRSMAMVRLQKKVDDFNIDDSTNEGAFVKNIFENAKTAVSGDPDNPQAAMMGIVQMLPKMMAGLQGGMQDGKFNPAAMFTTLSAVMGQMGKEMGVESKIEEIEDDEEEKEETPKINVEEVD